MKLLAGLWERKTDAAPSVMAGEISTTIVQFSYNMQYLDAENALKLTTFKPFQITLITEIYSLLKKRSNFM